MPKIISLVSWNRLQAIVLFSYQAFISGGAVSNLYLAMVRTGDSGPKGISALLIPADTPGLSFGANEKKVCM